MYDTSISLPKIAEVFGYLERNPEMIHIFDENPQYIQESHAFMSDVLFTILRDRIYREIGYEVEDTSVDIERYKLELADLLKKEKEYRKNLLISKYKNRSEFARILENQDLLAKVKSKNRKKSTIRDIYTYKSEKTGTPDVFSIFPVILATPDVACSILKLEEGVMDCIIIDEASQMFVDVAIPLIYRGKRLIVSGDREQMPPSAFFQSKNEDFDDNNNFTPSVTNEQSLLDAVDAKVDPVSKSKKLVGI